MALEIGNSGIYLIANIVNNKFYIGSAVNLKRREAQHFSDLLYNKHDNNYLQKAYNKYGTDNFKFYVLEFVSENQLIDREQYYIDKTRCFERHIGYNLRINAKNNLGIKYSPETCLKMSIDRTGKKHSEETKAKMRLVKRSEEFKRNVSITQTGKKRTEEQKLKMKQAQILKRHLNA